jgi:uncharacterized RDD family membrane protein YckC
MGPGSAFQGLMLLASVLASLVGLIWGISTSGKPSPEALLDRQYGIATATPARRLGGYLLDGVLLVVTLFIGWLIWFIIVAPRGQTPGKALVSTYVMREDGTIAGGWSMWGREFLVKTVLFGFINFFVGLASTVASLWCLWDTDRQCLWDKIMGSYVAYSPVGAPLRAPTGPISQSTPADRLRELQRLRAEGVITAGEYEERRQRLVEYL